MDGYAVRAADVVGAQPDAPVVLLVDGEVAAGHVPDRAVSPGWSHAGPDRRHRCRTGLTRSCRSRTRTAPPGSGRAPRFRSPFAGPLRPASTSGGPGSDLRAGRPPSGARCASIAPPPSWPSIAAGGHGDGARPPTAACRGPLPPVTAGDGRRRAWRRHRSPDSNSISIAAQAMDAGADVVRLGIAPDDAPEVLRLLQAGVAAADVVVVSGGVSVGAHDLVKDALAAVGRMQLWRVAIQPGKPLAYALAERPDGSTARLFFGLPGNPVSSFVTFELFVRPVAAPAVRALGPCRGADRVAGQAERGKSTSASGRRTFVRVRLVREAVRGWSRPAVRWPGLARADRAGQRRRAGRGARRCGHAAGRLGGGRHPPRLGRRLRMDLH